MILEFFYLKFFSLIFFVMLVLISIQLSTLIFRARQILHRLNNISFVDYL